MNNLYKPTDPVQSSKLRNELKLAIHVALQEVLQSPLHLHLLSSVIHYDLLQPTGEVFDIHFRVQVHPKPKEEKKDGSNATSNTT